ncbi:MAG: ABC transporter permease [Burkholderiaceae bacterium]|nr:ABC transporter permease [Burkholderiaceae bacterium]
MNVIAQPPALTRAIRRWAQARGRRARTAAQLLALALSPSSYAGAYRPALAREIYAGTAPLLPGFTALVTLASLVVIRIVVVTADSYGLSQYALEMVVRVLVLELLPLTAALFVAVRSTLPAGAVLARLRRQGALSAMRADGQDPMLALVVPRLAAGVFSGVALAVLSCVIALVVAYAVVHGTTFSAFDAFTRNVGRVFNPSVTLIFMLKTLFFGLSVSLVPLVTGLYEPLPGKAAMPTALRALAPMFGLILLIEVISLMGNYY